MPSDFGVSELLADEYDRFTSGMANLTDGGARAARAAAARVRPGDTQTRTIPIPGWDDVVHLRPRPTITPEMRALYYQARRRGAPSPLAPELTREIQRRSERARTMRQSATPEYAKAYGQVLTAIDNVQDLLSTSAAVGRFVLGGSARVLDRLAPTAFGLALEAAEREALLGLEGAALRQAAARLGLGLGARTLGRLLPILGPILLAADILRLLAWLGMMLFPAYAAMCRSAAEGTAAAVLPAGIALLSKRAAKQNVSAVGRFNVFGREARLNRAQTLRSWKPTIYNLIEGVQVTDSLFGVGMAFGGLVGLVSDSAFGAEQYGRGRDVHFDLTPFSQSARSVLAPYTTQLSNPELVDHRAAANVLAHAPAFQRVNDTFTLAEHVDALAAQLVAWSILRPVAQSAEMTTLVNEAVDRVWSPPAPQFIDTPAILQLEEGRVDGLGLWPLPGSPAVIRGGELMTTSAPLATKVLRQLAIDHDEEPARDFMIAAASQIAERASIVMTGSAEGFKLRWRPEWALTEALALGGRVPNLGQDDELTLRFWEECLTEMDRSGRQMLDPETLDRIAAAVGCQLFRAELRS